MISTRGWFITLDLNGRSTYFVVVVGVFGRPNDLGDDKRFNTL